MLASFYEPLLSCDGCRKLTRHSFNNLERRKYVCDEPRQREFRARKNFSKKNYSIEFDAMIYKCKECGTMRGWGNQRLDTYHENEN